MLRRLVLTCLFFIMVMATTCTATTITPACITELAAEGSTFSTTTVTVPADSDTWVPLNMPEHGLLNVWCDHEYFRSEIYTSQNKNSDIFFTDSFSDIKKGTYYLHLHGGSEEARTFVIYAHYYSLESATLENDKFHIGAHGNDDVVQYYKIIVPSRGYINIDFMSKNENDQPSFSFYDKNMKFYESDYANWSQKLFNGYPVYQAVEKGTYYLEVDNGPGPFEVKYSFTKDTAKKYTTRAKAKALKKGKVVTFGIYSKDKNTKCQRWYKIKIPKKKRLKIKNYSYASVNVFDSKGNYVKMLNQLSTSTDYSVKKLKPGTY